MKHRQKCLQMQADKQQIARFAHILTHSYSAFTYKDANPNIAARCTHTEYEYVYVVSSTT